VVPPQTPLGELTGLPDPLAVSKRREGKGRGEKGRKREGEVRQGKGGEGWPPIGEWSCLLLLFSTQ